MASMICLLPCSAQKGTMLETFGATTSMFLYNTYTTIGSIGDQFECDCIDDTTAIAMMDEQVSALNDLATQFDTLLASGYIDDPLDFDFLSDCIATMRLLSDEAYYLAQYMRSFSDYYVDMFHEKRNAAWSMIAELLGLDDW